MKFDSQTIQIINRLIWSVYISSPHFGIKVIQDNNQHLVHFIPLNSKGKLKSRNWLESTPEKTKDWITTHKENLDMNFNVVFWTHLNKK